MQKTPPFPSSDRDPRLFPFGVLLSPLGAAPKADGFHWFQNSGSALRFLQQEFLVDALKAQRTMPGPMGTEGLLDPSLRFDARFVGRFNFFQDEVEVVWFGSFEELKAETSGVAGDVMRNFDALLRGAGPEVDPEQLLVRFLHSQRGMGAANTPLQGEAQDVADLVGSFYESCPPAPVFDAEAALRSMAAVLPAGLLDWVVQSFKLDVHGIHGASHWARVMHMGEWLCQREGTDAQVVRLFAVIHDSCRESNGDDPEHGHRAAKLVNKLHRKGLLGSISPTQLGWLKDACKGHSEGGTRGPLPIQVCWDADRLDLARLGIRPSEHLLCTPTAKDPVLIDRVCRRFDDTAAVSNGILTEGLQARDAG